MNKEEKSNPEGAEEVEIKEVEIRESYSIEKPCVEPEMVMEVERVGKLPPPPPPDRQGN